MDNNKKYEGDDVVIREPYELGIIEGCTGAFCECGAVLHIKTPKIKNFYHIKCPRCGFTVGIYCGEE